MNVIEISKDWRVRGTDGIVGLPCILSAAESDISAKLPVSSGRAVVDVDGAERGADVYAGGQYVGRAGKTRALIDITKYLGKGADLRLGLGLGGGITRSVRLHVTDSDVYVLPYGVFVRTDSIADGGAELTVTADVRNDGAKRRLGVQFDVLMPNGRRVAGKRKYFTFMPGDKTVSVPVRMRRAKEYLPESPFMYTMSAVIMDADGNVLDHAETKFGVCGHGRYSAADKLVGCTLSHTGGMPGSLSIPEGEMRRLSALRDLGYNTVRFVGCPSDNVLRVTDELGMRVIVDIFDGWSWPRQGGDHTGFASDWQAAAAIAVRTLRNHPSVAIYSIGNAPEESYGRSGADRESALIATVRAMDDSRPVTAALAELVPLASELAEEGITRSEIAECVNDEGLVSLGRRVGLYAKRTEAFVAPLDVYGYAGYSPSYPHADKPFIGLATPPEHYFDAVTDMSRNGAHIGDLSDCGMDTGESGAFALGDIDSTCLPRMTGLYRSVLLGNPSAFITACPHGAPAMSGSVSWNFEEGSRVDINVFTVGDVVALYLNGRIVGRKLAGRLNRYIATFTTDFAPGVLEAVCFSRGREICRASLETTGAPRSVKLLTGSKRVSASAGGIAFVDAWILDKEGRQTGAACDIEFTVEGDGEIVALGNGFGPSLMSGAVSSTDGHAVAVVRGLREGKMTVRAKSAGLLRGSVTIKIKE